MKYKVESDKVREVVNELVLMLKNYLKDKPNNWILTALAKLKTYSFPTLLIKFFASSFLSLFFHYKRLPLLSIFMICFKNLFILLISNLKEATWSSLKRWETPTKQAFSTLFLQSRTIKASSVAWFTQSLAVITQEKYETNNNVKMK